ncbi:hypothetical protein TruAng_004059 [Truncatella angustata]|nr:hypothetical protein TruAng_004059 [Truncatella angustata]
MPIVDLGYELHQALRYNETTDIYTFSNIRYARQPIGDLRFRAPLPPLENRTVVQNGTGTRVCPQGIPEWQEKASQAIAQFSNSTVPFNLTKWEETLGKANAAGVNVNAVSSEDCLFLDVHVPGQFFRNRGKSSNFEVPVLVEIHGGGYVLGSKTGYPNGNFDPTGLLQHGNEGFIYVALNYRLGALGFLAGPLVQEDGALNAGILDQKLALEWVQKNIHLFGGSPRRVTVIGESGGGGSILVHLTQEKAPFAQIISQSPAIVPTLYQPPDTFSEFMSILNVSGLSEARELSSDVIIAANAKQIGAAPANTYIFGPVQDDRTLPVPVLRALNERQLDQAVNVMVSHNSLEGGFFFDPNVRTEADFQSWLFRSIPGLNNSQVDHLMRSLYPAAFDGSFGYIDQGTRQMSLWGEAVFDCNFLYMNKAKGGSSYACN